MTLYLLRHAEAETFADCDSARRLTPKGKTQAERAGNFCRRHGLQPAAILTSPVTRARQTAEIVAGALDHTTLFDVAWAACGMDPATAVRELQSHANLGRVMLVGHQPDLGHLAALLIGCRDAGSLHVRKSLLCGIDLSRGFRRGVLEFFVPARVMG